MPQQQRRRGSELEETLLAAAWQELRENGYAKLTMEGVAARAHTGKQVLYRRWPNRGSLVLAAIRRHVGSIAEAIPDTGSLRGDVLAVLAAAAARQTQIGPDVVHGLAAELPDIDPDFLSIMREVMGTIVRRAAERGEIASADLPARVLTLPTDLVRHDVLLTRVPVSQAALTDIVDEVFLPLVRAAQPVQSSSTGSASTP